MGDSVSLNYLYKNYKERYKTGEKGGSFLWGCKRLRARLGVLGWEAAVCTSEKMTVSWLSVASEQC